MAAPSYSISDLAREFEVTTRTMRFYEERGLLAPARSGQERRYSVRDRTRLKLILRGKRLGFSLAEVADMLAMYDAPDGEFDQVRTFVDKMRGRRRELLAQRDEISQVLAELDTLEARCLALLAATPATTGGPAESPPASTATNTATAS